MYKNIYIYAHYFLDIKLTQKQARTLYTATILGDAISPGLEKKLEKISVWNFEEQKMRSVDYIQVPGMPSFNMWSAPIEAVNILMFYPVSVQMNDDLLNWSK